MDGPAVNEATWLASLATEEAGPKGTASLTSRGQPLASPEAQLALLAGQGAPDFEAALARAGWAEGLKPGALEILQINLGKLCNMTCRHCHVDAGPDRVAENMNAQTLAACVALLDQLPSVSTVDITGGAPELHPRFRELVDAATSRGKHVIDRCNLTVLLLPRFADLPEWLGARGVELVCSLPHSRSRSTDAQRGAGTFDRSIAALRRLNEAGYGQGDPARRLTLMHNPVGAFLPAGHASMEREWKDELQRRHGVRFDRLIALNNMPISRFLEWLEASGNTAAYMSTLTSAFNPAAIAGLMCRNTLSVVWDGALYDCDFNQQLELELAGRPRVQDLRATDIAALAERRIVTAPHCFGCTAGAGSSCGGATAT